MLVQEINTEIFEFYGGFLNLISWNYTKNARTSKFSFEVEIFTFPGI